LFLHITNKYSNYIEHSLGVQKRSYTDTAEIINVISFGHILKH